MSTLKKKKNSVGSSECSGMRYISEAVPLEWTAAPHRSTLCPALPLLPSGWQQRTGSPNRRLPLSDYNLWSISIIGGVCRDSYSNNYLDWSVSKATNPPTPPLHGERECVCMCVRIAWHGVLREAWDLSFALSYTNTHMQTVTLNCTLLWPACSQLRNNWLFLKTCLFKDHSKKYSAFIPQ